MARQAVIPSTIRFGNNETKVSPAYTWGIDTPPEAVAAHVYADMVDHVHNKDAIISVTVEESDDQAVWVVRSTVILLGGSGAPHPDTGVVSYSGGGVIVIRRRFPFVRLQAIAQGRPRIGVDVEFF